MILTIAVALFAVAGAVLLQARASVKRRAYKSLFLNVAVAVLLLIGAGIVTSYGLRSPTALMPRPDSKCTWGLGAAADGC
jgi:hypothetical protein